MKKYINLHNMVFNQPHLCTPEYAETVLAVLSDKLGIAEGMFDVKNDPKDKRDANVSDSGTYTLPIVGSMVHRGGMMDALSGTMSYEGIQAEIQSALDSPDVKNILLDIDSSGGAVAGAFDLRDFILQAKEEKPIYAIARDSMCSAAYLIGSACTKVYATQTASVGSIGVVAMHVDQSAKNEMEGIKPTFVYAGAHKVSGNSHEALEGEALSYLQESVNDSYDMFVEAVAEARGLDTQAIRDTEARVYKGRKATTLGLVDGVRAMKTVYKELADLSQKRVITQTNMSKQGMKMDNEVNEKLEADLTAEVETLKANMEKLTSAIISEGYTINADGIFKEEAKEAEIVEYAGKSVNLTDLPEEAAETIRTLVKEKADAELAEFASVELPNFAKDEAMALVAQFKGNEAVMSALKAADNAIGGMFEEKGQSDATVEFNTAGEKLEALAKAHAEEHKVSIHKARVEVAQTAQGRELQKEAMKEKV